MIDQLTYYHQIHTGIIRGPLTRNLGILFGDVLEEIRAGFAESVGAKLNHNRKSTFGITSHLQHSLLHRVRLDPHRVVEVPARDIVSRNKPGIRRPPALSVPRPRVA